MYIYRKRHISAPFPVLSYGYPVSMLRLSYVLITMYYRNMTENRPIQGACGVGTTRVRGGSHASAGRGPCKCRAETGWDYFFFGIGSV